MWNTDLSYLFSVDISYATHIFCLIFMGKYLGTHLMSSIIYFTPIHFNSQIALIQFVLLLSYVKLNIIQFPIYLVF